MMRIESNEGKGRRSKDIREMSKIIALMPCNFQRFGRKPAYPIRWVVAVFVLLSICVTNGIIIWRLHK